MAKSRIKERAEEERRNARIAEQAAAQRGPVPPEIGQSVEDPLEEHPPYERVSRLGPDAARAEAEVDRRRGRPFREKARHHRPRGAALATALVVLGLLVILGGLWGLFLR